MVILRFCHMLKTTALRSSRRQEALTDSAGIHRSHYRVGVPRLRGFLSLLVWILLSSLLTSTPAAPADGSITYEPKAGPGQGKHVVFLTGDEEYRGEEGLPMLAKILSQRHGFKCTVLFSLNSDGTINPDAKPACPTPKPSIPRM